ncbi:MAG: hypothetical protein HFG32_11505 [Eubacterium sp.]|jgi:predicted  nucleic acid-binding Zn-ribbon protein|nr:hypothetical protein [Eubacterium sp.]
MADSKFFDNQYKSYKNQVKSLQKDLTKLIRIRDSLTGDFFDEQSNVNKELDELKEDLAKAVRHDGTFSSIASSCHAYKEKGSTADSGLSSAIYAIESEIAQLNNQKSTAEGNMEQSYKQYQAKKTEERQNMLDQWKGLF